MKYKFYHQVKVISLATVCQWFSINTLPPIHIYRLLSFLLVTIWSLKVIPIADIIHMSHRKFRKQADINLQITLVWLTFVIAVVCICLPQSLALLEVCGLVDISMALLEEVSHCWCELGELLLTASEQSSSVCLQNKM